MLILFLVFDHIYFRQLLCGRWSEAAEVVQAGEMKSISISWLVLDKLSMNVVHKLVQNLNVFLSSVGKNSEWCFRSVQPILVKSDNVIQTWDGIDYGVLVTWCRLATAFWSPFLKYKTRFQRDRAASGIKKHRKNGKWCPLSSVTLNFQVTIIAMNSGSQMSEIIFLFLWAHWLFLGTYFQVKANILLFIGRCALQWQLHWGGGRRHPGLGGQAWRHSLDGACSQPWKKLY